MNSHNEDTKQAALSQGLYLPDGEDMSVRSGGVGGGGQQPSILKFRQIWPRFKIFLGTSVMCTWNQPFFLIKCYDLL